jgi:hypothetical protein
VPEVEISVVVPVYKCADCLRHLHERLHTCRIDPMIKQDLPLRREGGAWVEHCRD